jgi:hypothetical protein
MKVVKGETFTAIIESFLKSPLEKYEQTKVACSSLGTAFAKLHKAGNFDPKNCTSRLVFSDAVGSNISYDHLYGISIIDTAEFNPDREMPIKQDLNCIIQKTLFMLLIFMKSAFTIPSLSSYMILFVKEFIWSYTKAIEDSSACTFQIFTSIFQDMIKNLRPTTRLNYARFTSLKNIPQGSYYHEWNRQQK